MTQKDRDYPAMKWHPETGENGVFHSASEVPEGWLDTHPNNLPAAIAPKKVVTQDEVLPMTREEIVKELTEGEIPFKAKDKDKKLYELLVASLKAHLTESKVEFPETATGPELLALVPKSE